MLSAKLSFIFILFLTVLAEIEKYNGLPIGEIRNKLLDVHAFVFVADSHTIVLDNFTNRPGPRGCSALMLGPARVEDENERVGPGILLPYTRMDFTWEDIRRRKSRKRRSVNNSLQNSDESYEIIEYVDDVEEEEFREEPLNASAAVLLVKDGESKKPEGKIKQGLRTHVPPSAPPTAPTSTEVTTATTAMLKEIKSTAETTSVFPVTTYPTLLPESAITLQPMIVFNKKRLKPHKYDKLDKKKANEETKSSTNFVVRQSILLRNLPSEYSLPPAKNDKIAFLINNGAMITDYKWLGLWNQCSNKSSPHVWLDKVDPPREEDIGNLMAPMDKPLSGAVRLLNCNTILVQRLKFHNNAGKNSSFFYVGTGRLPHYNQKVRARVIGYESLDPLDDFDEEDVMIRLPHGVRTFDVDFLAIIDDKNSVVLAHVDIPSVLVPPCSDYSG